MAILRWTPPTVGDVVKTTDGLFQISSNWTPAQVPGNGDTGLIGFGGLTTINSQIDKVTLLALPAQSQPTTTLNFQDTRIGQTTFLIVDGSQGGSNIAINVSFSFENDGVIDFIGTNISASASSATSVVNKGVINFRNSAPLLGAGGVFENDGTISIANQFATRVSTAITGTGRVVVKPSSVVEFSGPVSSGQTIQLAGNTDARSTIQIDSTSTFAGTVSGFVSGDTILLPNRAGPISAVTYQQNGEHSGSLQFKAGLTVTTLRFAGDYQQGDFAIVSGPNGVGISTARTDQGIVNGNEVYRFFDTTNGTHFFTASVSEREGVVSPVVV